MKVLQTLEPHISFLEDLTKMGGAMRSVLTQVLTNQQFYKDLSSGEFVFLFCLEECSMCDQVCFVLLLAAAGEHQCRCVGLCIPVALPPCCPHLAIFEGQKRILALCQHTFAK